MASGLRLTKRRTVRNTATTFRPSARVMHIASKTPPGEDAHSTTMASIVVPQKVRNKGCDPVPIMANQKREEELVPKREALYRTGAIAERK